MTPTKLISAALIAASVLVAPAVAQNNLLAMRHASHGANASVSLTGRHADRHGRIPELRFPKPTTTPEDIYPVAFVITGTTR